MKKTVMIATILTIVVGLVSTYVLFSEWLDPREYWEWIETSVNDQALVRYVKQSGPWALSYLSDSRPSRSLSHRSPVR